MKTNRLGIVLAAIAGPNLSLVASYCESDRLFESLDRRRFPESADQGFQKTERADGPVVPVPALP